LKIAAFPELSHEGRPELVEKIKYTVTDNIRAHFKKRKGEKA